MNSSALSNEELRSLLGAARGSRERDWLMILVAYWHGLRASEVTAIVRDDIDGGYLTVKRLKGSLRTVQPLMEHPDPLLDERAGLFEYTKALAGVQRLFPVGRIRFWQLVQQYSRAAGLPSHKRHPHMLKHSIASQAIGSAGIENTRQWLGHKSISSTGEYLRVTDEQAGEAVKRALGI